MVQDPTNVKYRKPRQFRNTPAQRYIQLISLAVTGIYGIGLFCFWKRNIAPFMNSELTEDELAMKKDYDDLLLKDVIDKLFARKEAKEETKSKENKDT